jgi:hypothetical protein
VGRGEPIGGLAGPWGRPQQGARRGVRQRRAEAWAAARAGGKRWLAGVG